MTIRQRPDPLSWGEGPRLFEAFHEPTCPYSVRALAKLPQLIALMGADRITVRLRLQSQPWHMYSGVIVRAALAASLLPEGRDAALRVLTEVGARREEFEPADHCRGPVMAVTPAGIIARIEELTGYALAELFETPALTTEIKWHCKYARQNGIHVSPTFMVDGLVQADLSSGDAIETWAARIDALA